MCPLVMSLFSRDFIKTDMASLPPQRFITNVPSVHNYQVCYNYYLEPNNNSYMLCCSAGPIFDEPLKVGNL